VGVGVGEGKQATRRRRGEHRVEVLGLAGWLGKEGEGGFGGGA
jgi:hypothetical protein